MGKLGKVEEQLIKPLNLTPCHFARVRFGTYPHVTRLRGTRGNLWGADSVGAWCSTRVRAATFTTPSLPRAAVERAAHLGTAS
jgi:hypothetical protein